MREKKKQWKTFMGFVARLCIGILIISCVLDYKTGISRADDGTEIILSKRNDADNVPFRAENLFPGDRIEKEFCVNVSCGEEVTVCFGTELDDAGLKLAQVLGFRVELTNHGEVLYDGLMAEMPECLEYRFTVAPTKEELIYHITVYMDTSVGNEYQNTGLNAKFGWWIAGEDQDKETSEEETMEDIPSLDTGDHTNFVKWTKVTICAVLVMVVLAILRKRKGETG